MSDARDTSGAAARVGRILIVEDDPDSRDFLARILGKFGYNSECAATLAEGRRKLSAHPAVVNLDLALPDGNGVELLRQIREQQLPTRTVLLTGAADVAADAVMMKPDVVFTKPLDASELVSWLKSLPPED